MGFLSGKVLNMYRSRRVPMFYFCHFFCLRDEGLRCVILDSVRSKIRYPFAFRLRTRLGFTLYRVVKASFCKDGSRGRKDIDEKL